MNRKLGGIGRIRGVHAGGNRMDPHERAVSRSARGGGGQAQGSGQAQGGGQAHGHRLSRKSLISAALSWSGWERDDAGSAERLVDYGVYRLSKAQYVQSAGAGYLLAFAAIYLFYHGIPVSLVLGCFGLIAPRLYRQSLLLKRKERLKLQFKEALYSITSSLAAGRSVENAFMAALEDLKLLYPDPRTELLQEFQVIRNRLLNAEPLEFALHSLAKRARIDDLTQFADVFAACKRSGGDLIEVMKRTSQTIGEKLDVQQEIAVMVAQKRFEARIMMAVPFVFLGFLSLAAPDYMAPLYSGAGYLLLTAALAVLLFCFRMIAKIMDIRV